MYLYQKLVIAQTIVNIDRLCTYCISNASINCSIVNIDRVCTCIKS